MRNKLFFIFLFLTYFASLDLLIGNTPISNIEVLDSLSKNTADNINQFLINHNLNSVFVSVDETEGNWLLTEHLLQNNKIKLLTPQSQSKETFPLIEIHTKELKIEYSLHENSDSLFRTGKIELSAFLKTKDKTEIIDSLNFVFEDEISCSDVELIKGKYPFANPKIPEREQTFWENIVEPVVVITTAIITLVLLFTVRSN